MAAEVERKLLNHYKLTSLYPSEWPDREDESDGDDEQNELASPVSISSPTSVTARPRYAALDRHASTISQSSHKRDLVQKDEPDPLGISASVVHELRRRGLPVEDNLKLRNRFMLSSTTFSPTLFLSQVHQDASTESLLRGLDFLSRSIEQKSASLKVLVESNFERFVRAKATIDNVYTEMRTQGQAAEPQAAVVYNRRHSRVTSRGQAGNFRTMSGIYSAGKPMAAGSNKKKNALTKESEYGVLGIKAPLIELAVKAEEVWGPALGGKEKEEELKAVLSYVEQNRAVFKIGGALQDAIKRRDYASLVDEYNRAKRLADEARSLAEAARDERIELSDMHIRRIVVAAKVWADTQAQLTHFKRDAWNQLANPQTYFHADNPDDDKDAHIELISTLLQLGVDENPIWFWLTSRYKHLKDKFTSSFDRMRVEVEVARRKLSTQGAPSVHVCKVHLQSVTASAPTLGQDRIPSNMDTPKVLDFWEKEQTTINALLSSRDGLLGEIIDFWDTAQGFISGKAQRALPNSLWSAPDIRDFLSLSDDEVVTLQSYASDLISNLRESVYAFFVQPPMEDISALFSPNPDTPASAATPSEPNRRFTFDPHNIPAPLSKRGESWEKYSFWPPYANSLSGVYYLGRMLTLVGGAASDVASMSLVQENPRLLEALKSLVQGVRESCVQAVCAAWDADSNTCKLLEDWTRSPERRDLTNMPFQFAAFEETVLTNMQKILYMPETANAVSVPPSSRLLALVKNAFVNSMYKALSGTVENAERLRKTDDDLLNDPDGITIPALAALHVDASASMVDASNRSVRMLLSLSNLAYLRTTALPQLTNFFESAFSCSLTPESQTVRDVLGQIDARLFQSYIAPTTSTLSSLIASGISSPSWSPNHNVSQPERPTNAKPYVYEVLLHLVLVHTEISSTAPPLLAHILSTHLEDISGSLLSAFSSRPHFSLPELVQATLDVELVAQTLSTYTTERASDLQSRIYLVLDERTDGESRARLQGELPEMRASLKRLREGTRGLFGCFRRERRGRDRGERGDREKERRASGQA